MPFIILSLLYRASDDIIMNNYEILNYLDGRDFNSRWLPLAMNNYGVVHMKIITTNKLALRKISNKLVVSRERLFNIL